MSKPFLLFDVFLPEMHQLNENPGIPQRQLLEPSLFLDPLQALHEFIQLLFVDLPGSQKLQK